MHYENQVNIIFYLLATISGIIMSAGIFGMIHLWRLGKKPTLNTDIKPSKWLSSFISAAFLQTQILEYDILAWIAHLLIFYGFISLLILTSFHSFLIWFVPETTLFFRYFTEGSGNLLIAVWGDFWGLVLLAGILMALYRRYITKPEHTNTISDDAVAIWLLFALTVTGFMCEAIRLGVYPDAHDAAGSFAVCWLVPILSGLGLAKTHLTGMFWIHSVISFVFFIYIPFSKFRHIFAAPLDYAFVTAGNQYSKDGMNKRWG